METNDDKASSAECLRISLLEMRTLFYCWKQIILTSHRLVEPDIFFKMFKINKWTTIPGNDPFNSLLTKLRFGLDDIEECFNHFKSFNESQINNSFEALYKQSNLLADAKSVDNQPLNLETRLNQKRLGTRSSTVEPFQWRKYFEQ